MVTSDTAFFGSNLKVNLPITNIEHLVDPHRPIVSKTDLKGAITYANQAFIDISGFERQDLIGQNHNLVRHPDMPAEAFADLWERVKNQGKGWQGIVKNRCKNGDHYWVSAFVVPVKHNGQTTGYMSVRSPASRAEISAAQALYAKLGRDGKLPTPSRLPALTDARVNLAALGAFDLLLLTQALIHGQAGDWLALALGCALSLGLLARGWSSSRRMRQIAHMLDNIAEGRLNNG